MSGTLYFCRRGYGWGKTRDPPLQKSCGAKGRKGWLPGASFKDVGAGSRDAARGWEGPWPRPPVALAFFPGGGRGGGCPSCGRATCPGRALFFGSNSETRCASSVLGLATLLLVSAGVPRSSAQHAGDKPRQLWRRPPTWPPATAPAAAAGWPERAQRVSRAQKGLVQMPG